MLLFILLDACRFDYINRQDAPFLAEVQQRGLSAPAMPTFGFEPDAAYLAGLTPRQSRGGAHYYFGTSNNPFAGLRWLPDWLEQGPEWSSKLLRYGLTRWIRWYSGQRDAGMARIPFQALPCFTPARSTALDSEYAFGAPSLFDALRAAGKSWFINVHPAHSVRADDVVRRVAGELRQPVDLVFLHIGDLDAAGHRYGPDSTQRRATLQRVDRALAALHSDISTRFGEPDLLILGDHGMVQVTSHLSVSDSLHRLPLAPGRDYHCFLDSTMARFWFTTPASRRMILAELEQLQHGHLLSEAECRTYGLPVGKNDFAEALFLADPGVLILPNYFQGRRPVRGMHGYAPEHPGQQGVFIARSQTIQAGMTDTAIDMREIYPMTLELLGLHAENEKPETTLWQAAAAHAM